jgi:nitrate/nitrite-specific signal transduction histidine kinase
MTFLPITEGIQGLLINFAILLGIVLALVGLIAWVSVFLARRLSAPLVELSTIATEVAGGNLFVSANVVGPAEIAQVASTFNDMTARLREFITTLENRVADRTKALATSAEVSRRLATILDPVQLVGEVVNEVRNAFDYYYAQIYLLDEAGENLVIAGGTGEAGASMLASKHSLPKGRGLVGRAAGTNNSVLVPDVSLEEGWLPNELLPETKTEAAIPISVGSQVLGVLDVQHNLVNGLTRDDVTLLESLAGQVAISLRNARSYEQSRKQAELESLVNVIGQRIQRTTSIEDTLQTAIRELGTAIGASRVRARIGGTSPVIEPASISYSGNGTSDEDEPEQA